jgi:hypothetical protein
MFIVQIRYKLALHSILTRPKGPIWEKIEYPNIDAIKKDFSIFPGITILKEKIMKDGTVIGKIIKMEEV